MLYRWFKESQTLTSLGIFRFLLLRIFQRSLHDISEIFKWYLRREGGLGSKIQVDLIWKPFPIQSQRFLQNVKLKLLARDIRVWVQLGVTEITHFLNILPYKNELKIALNCEYFHQKCPLNMFDGVFSCTSTY